MPRPALWMLPAVLTMLSCEREYTVEELCAGEGPSELVLGHGSGAEFAPFADGEDVTITLAPQGGYGVTVRARTLGALANAPVTLVMSSSWEGEPTGSFDWGQIPLYCQEDGHGLFFGAVVPLDPERFPTVEDLAVLEGERVTLEATITDARGVVVSGQAEVVLHLPEGAGDTGDTGG